MVAATTTPQTSAPSAVATSQQGGAFGRYVLTELQKISSAIQTQSVAAPQAAAVVPQSPLIGTIRYATGDWATSLGGEGFYGYTASGWIPLAGKKQAAFGTVSSCAVPSQASTIATAIGLGLSITPNSSGQVVIIASGIITGISSTEWISLRYGTGTPPTSGTNIASDTIVGQEQSPVFTASTHGGWCLNGLLTGLTPGTKYWFDVAVRVASSATTVSTANGTAHEL